MLCNLVPAGYVVPPARFELASTDPPASPEPLEDKRPSDDPS
jgi:hypothetical protein